MLKQTIFLLVTITSCSKYSNNISEKKSGQCYAKARYAPVYKTEEKMILVYTGDNNNQPELKDTIIKTMTGKKIWVMKKMSSACLSANPEDCYVKCLIDEEIDEKIKILPSGTKIKEVEPRLLKEKILISEEVIKYIQVLCSLQISKDVISKVEQKLVELKYLSTVSGKFDAKLNSALYQYQEDHNLGIGLLSYETLESLGVKY